MANFIGTANSDFLTGGAGNDWLSGGAGSDTLLGLAGNDSVQGGADADWLDGGAGTDTLSYAASTSGVSVNLFTGVGIGGEADGDVITGFEHVVGSVQNDLLTGDSAANRLDGGNGNDTLVGGAGADTLIGGAGLDYADYSASTAGVSIDLLTGVGTGGAASGDSLSGIDHLVGSAFADRLRGNTGVNRLIGGEGNDTLIGGAGADSLEGGDGDDTADFSGETAAISVNLATGTGGGDSLVSIEQVIGSAFNDTIVGGTGNDTLIGGAGFDSLVGGAGTDVAVFTGRRSDYNLGINGRVVRLVTGETDAVAGIEQLRFSDATVDLANGVVGALLDDDEQDNAVDEGDEAAAYTGLTLSATSSDGKAIGYTLTGAAASKFTIEAGTGRVFKREGVTLDAETTDIQYLSVIATNGFDSVSQSYAIAVNNVDEAPTGLDDVDPTFNRVSPGAAAGTTTGIRVAATDPDGGTIAYSLTTGGDRLAIDANGLVTVKSLTGLVSGDVIRFTVAASDGTNSTERAFNLLVANPGDLTMRGGADNDTLVAGDANNWALYGQGGNDSLVGNAAANRLEGGDGNDTLKGGGGADSLIGGAGVDWIDFSGVAEGVHFDVRQNVYSQGALGVYTDEIENISGSTFNDTIWGGASNNLILGGFGDDYLTGQYYVYMYGSALIWGGNDTLIGGYGSDTFNQAVWISYSDSSTGVNVNLRTGTGTYGTAEGDVYLSVGHVEGSKHNDTIYSNANGGQILNSSSGDDLIYARAWGAAGGDFINGGDGYDTVSYEFEGAANVSLQKGSSQNEAVPDYYTSIEAVIGSNSAGDFIEGNSIGNVINGLGGNDDLSGRGGNDTLTGGSGNDSLDGGAGDDVFLYNTQSAGTDIIDDFESGRDVIDVSELSLSLVTSFTGKNQIMITEMGHQLRINLDTITATSEIIINLTGIDSIKVSDLVGLV